MMNTQVTVTLPVADINRSGEFVRALGFEVNPETSCGDSISVVVSEAISFMFLTRDHFERFSPKPICDTSKNLQVLISLNLSSREEVDQMVRKAVAAGGAAHEEAEDFGFMYCHGFFDPDGHAWGVNHMDVSKLP